MTADLATADLATADDQAKQPFPPQGWLGLETKYLPTDWICPRSVLQSSIFSGKDVGGQKPRAQLAGTPLAGFGKVLIWQIGGYQLDQPTADVWLELIKRSLLLKEEGGQVLVGFDEVTFLRAIKRDTGGTSRKWLRETLSRLGLARFRIAVGTEEEYEIIFEGSLVGNIQWWYPGAIAKRKNAAKKVVTGLRLNVELAALFGGTAWSKVDSDIRLSLSEKSLAQWLHSFYSTHRDPFYIRVETIHVCSGCSTIRSDKFLTNLRQALADLAQATGWMCGVTEEEDKKDHKVVVKKTSGGACPALLPAFEPTPVKPKFVLPELTAVIAKPRAKPVPPVIWTQAERKAKRLQSELEACLGWLPAEIRADRHKEVVKLAEHVHGGTLPQIGRQHHMVFVAQLELEAALLMGDKPARDPELRALVQASQH